jgi:YHS domain-containing protein
MCSGKLKITKLLALAAMLAAILVFFGCKKKTGAQPSTVSVQADQTVQTTCPVMTGNPIDKNVFVMYQGKKVYFCCPACKAKFQADPKKYLDKLPQFNAEAESMKQQTEPAVEKASEEMEKTAEKLPQVK